MCVRGRIKSPKGRVSVRKMASRSYGGGVQRGKGAGVGAVRQQQSAASAELHEKGTERVHYKTSNISNCIADDAQYDVDGHVQHTHAPPPHPHKNTHIKAYTKTCTWYVVRSIWFNMCVLRVLACVVGVVHVCCVICCVYGVYVVCVLCALWCVLCVVFLMCCVWCVLCVVCGGRCVSCVTCVACSVWCVRACHDDISLRLFNNRTCNRKYEDATLSILQYSTVDNEMHLHSMQ